MNTKREHRTHAEGSPRGESYSPSGRLVLTNRSYTNGAKAESRTSLLALPRRSSVTVRKHYYAGAERVAARMGGGGLDALYHAIGTNNTIQTKANLLFDQSLEQVNNRILYENDLDCIMHNDFAKEEFGHWIDGIPYQMQAGLEFDHGQFKDMVNSMLDDINRGQEKEVYFYHSDHLGSGSWITNANGDPVQHLQYLPYGEPFVNHRISSYNERFTFTGKELDEETGYGYFGARYYDPTLLTSFLSIDRYADKYPSLSPYHYCAWNPIKLTDPSGDTVTFSGNKVLQQQALKWMNNASNHLAYSLNENGTLIGNLKPGVKMEDLSGGDKHMLAIIGDSHNNVKIDLQDNDEISNGYYINNVAQWNGTTICRPVDNTQIITGNQVVNVLGLEDWQQRSDSPRLAGQIIYHEIAEGYASCLLSRSENRALSPFSETSSADYIKCHSNANDYFWGNVRCDPKTNKIELNYYIL